MYDNIYNRRLFIELDIRLVKRVCKSKIKNVKHVIIESKEFHHHLQLFNGLQMPLFN
ncbi:hypothetical protein GLOIN_2v1668966 [Rhizophagus irregularis DAOM 181602=DAOM 197198]|uniref:Uncharacterized protein n=1 Tax=Rhizophagus irregularis (strain DAOM 181602 / DAOM 197198 / MUCL 43194) TaxID=747089 RepID=A0A2P4PII6_RHIID|nr:hypothetical protein GLOIN_2v1668966 [Rhizophagus irregularis DAOM 181602=DAOM 197198]POG65188.1 hypothetical protein GLOIN_2v1668966 [Rhizophagus irregularis DAOM 181602=DAOM 197198]|eukprot:XP_025172054.1 hypothetical protein GLOIN_2v1668966 [Rhizophagus irregularis DAOM 181602=DAOM 197198]